MRLRPSRLRRLAFILPAWLAACAAPAGPPRLDLARVSFADLPGWRADSAAEALPALRRSCEALVKLPDAAPMGPAEAGKAGDWRALCAAAGALDDADDQAARAFFETYFTPYAAGDRGRSEILLTGYYEPVLEGARIRSAKFTVPLLKRPPDLVSADLGAFRSAWRGERLAGRVENGRLVPYASRAEIEAGALDRFHLAIAWVADPVAAFFLQIQGSGRINLVEGGTLRLGYDGENGRPYVAIGRPLVERGALAPDRVSMQSISSWLAAHPLEAGDVMDRNQSYVFFRAIAGEGPVGTEGVALTPGRSLAVDRNFVPLGAPVWLDAEQDGTAVRRLAVAQDTGAAIRGPLRGDLYWGAGEEAAARAGVMRAFGRYFLLLPRPKPASG